MAASKKILITGSTDGIGLAAAKKLYSMGHTVLLHGRDPQKLQRIVHGSDFGGAGISSRVKTYVADFSCVKQVDDMAKQIAANHATIDVLINNAGILKTTTTRNDGLDVRFTVNVISPYLLTRRLLPIIIPGSNRGGGGAGRIANVSSAAQRSVDLDAMSGGGGGKDETVLDDMEAYAQSKLAVVAWTNYLAAAKENHHINLFSVNPGSLLDTKMVREGLSHLESQNADKGRDVLVRAAIDGDDSAFGNDANGRYFDNDSGDFGSPHEDAGDPEICRSIVETMNEILAERDIYVS